MLRIHLTPEDLAATKVAAGPHPLWEVIGSLRRLQERSNPLLFGQWRSRAAAIPRSHADACLTLVPRQGYCPDFLTPAEGSLELDAGIDAILATSRRRLNTELSLLAERHPLPSWTSALASGQRDARTDLAAALRVYHQHAIAPYWASIRNCIDADRSLRTRALADGGLNGLLNSFRPALRWQPPALEVDCQGPDRDIHLYGQGLLLVPSYFFHPRPCALADPSLPQVVVYPAERPLAHPLAGPLAPPAGARRRRDDALAALLGHTRTTVLHLIAEAGPITTTELARRAAISPAAASQQATTLRNAGLTTSQRHANTVLHTITALGTALRNGDANPPGAG
ncbi:MAG: winged helix-turn-helix domain-containing protein [Streptosporangiaceae bacterium]|jgi:DNA-binding transcriptional ArsR family regulator